MPLSVLETGKIFLSSLILILFLQFLLWILSLRIKNAAIVDVFWGIGFVILSWIGFYYSEHEYRYLLPLLVTIWGLRLSYHIAKRTRGAPEDRRYKAMRQAHPKFVWWSLIWIFLFQGLLIFFIGLPLLFWSLGKDTYHYLMFFGFLIWCVGFGFESIGDWQLSQFKNNPTNKGKVLNTGLWRYTRHPNYFGDSVVWFGFCILTVSVLGLYYSFLIYSPIVMTIFLLRISGVALLEKDIAERRPDYARYIQETSAFFPRRPRRKS